MEIVLLLTTCLAGALVLYHHAGYPLLLKFLSERRVEHVPPTPERRYRTSTGDDELPYMTIIIPAFNEEEFIGDKVRNLAALDYPSNRFRAIVACDGCTDRTAETARQTLMEPECSSLRLEIREFSENRGKVAVINDVMSGVEGDLIALGDVSALISIDALLVAAQRFEDADIGVISGSYRLLNPGGPGERAYWAYQTSIKARESRMGSTLGVHGAFYLFRRALFEPLDLDTINDDFLLPMSIVARGFRAVYEPRVNAVELECATTGMDRRRRIRIAAGNTQQLARLARLLKPSFKGTAFAFASGKALRVLMPFCLLWLLLGSALLASTSWVFAALFLGQISVYATALIAQLLGPEELPSPIATIHYLVQGHISGLIGAITYLVNRRRIAWGSSVATLGDR